MFPQDVDVVERKQWVQPRTLNDYFVMFGKALSQNEDESGDRTGERDAHVGFLFGADFIGLLEQLKSKCTDAGKAAPATLEEMEAKKAKRREAREEREGTDAFDTGFGCLWD